MPTGQGRRAEGSGERRVQAPFLEPPGWCWASASLSVKRGGWRRLPWGLRREDSGRSVAPEVLIRPPDCPPPSRRRRLLCPFRDAASERGGGEHTADFGGYSRIRRDAKGAALPHGQGHGGPPPGACAHPDLPRQALRPCGATGTRLTRRKDLVNAPWCHHRTPLSQEASETPLRSPRGTLGATL